MPSVLDIIEAIRALSPAERRRLVELERQLEGGESSDAPAAPASVQEQRDHLWVLESLDRIHRAMHAVKEPEEMTSNVLRATLELFACDRAWLLHPCNPGASSWRAVMEHTRPEFARAFAPATPQPMRDEVMGVFRRALGAPGAIVYGPNDSDHPVPAETAEGLGVRSLICMALFPEGDKPYLFGLHHCSRAWSWTAPQQRLFEEIAHRLADALTSVLMFRSLRQSERRLDDAQRIAHVGYWDRDLESGEMTLSDEACRIFGFSPSERILDVTKWHERWVALLHPEDRARTADAAAAALQGGPRYDVEYRVIRPGGDERIIHSRGEVTRDEHGTAKRMFGMMQDITELRRAEHAFRTSEARFRTIVEHAADAFLLLDEQFVVMNVNRRACESLGYDREQLLGRHVRDFDADLDASRMRELAQRVRAGETVTFETRHRRSDGSVFPVEIRCTQLEQDGSAFLSLVRDITERKRAERALLESHALLKAVVEGTSDPIFIKDLEGRYLMINSAGAQSLGRSVSEMIGKRDHELFPPEVALSMTERDREVLATEHAQTFQETRAGSELTHHYLTTKGVYRDSDGKVIGLFGISRDVTDLKRLEDQLRQSQKLEAVGKLAGGIAHDFNNLLTVINGCVDLAMAEFRGARGVELLSEVRQAGVKAANLTRQLLAFSRRQVLNAQIVDLNKTLEQVGSLLRRLIGEDVELIFAFEPALGLVKVDPTQFEQAVVNLAVNARDAMPAGGRLSIATRNVELDAAFAASHDEVRAGQYAEVTVSDSGHGMDAKTVARIFDPFFTTKPVGKGTGLGLAMVYGFLKQSGGHVEVESGLGYGTTFRLYLPFASELAGEGPRRLEAPKNVGGRETVLLVEDEAAVRRLLTRVLSGSGYRVIQACNGEEALDIANDALGKLDLLVTDLVMPRMGGRQLATSLREKYPHLRVLFVSGYAEDVSFERELDPCIGFLQKPLAPPVLIGKVRELLDSKCPAHGSNVASKIAGVPRQHDG